ncbi:MaoC/PaaZ C-terminal domain-containing protein [Brevibacterium ihuae]|uniref:MaoC/PaaZ C-terminal domain-containing protein n=1 Tax=Brevibacterium ihuae TaxID=1631743 RepID=UPI000C75BA24|nr:MaoC/PaaZ C-terminal domain-containing protein [Brevibacterium ihuae]
MSAQSSPVPREEVRRSASDLAPRLADLEVGRTVVSASIPVSRADLVRYAGASGDYNHIHWNERFAREVGLENVIAHGMLTMGSVISRISEWAVDPGAIVDYRTRFTAPVVVPDAESGAPDTPTAFLEMTAVVGAVDPEAGIARLDVEVSAGEKKVLGRTQVKVRLS